MPKYFKRLLMFSLCFGAIPVIVLGVFSYHRAASTIQEKVEESSRQLLYQNQLTVERVLEEADYSTIQWMNSRPMMYAMDKPLSPKDFLQYRELSNGLQTLEPNGIEVANTTLVNLQQDWLVSKNGLEVLSQLPTHAFYQGLARQSQTSTWVSHGSGMFTNEEPYISLVKKWPILDDSMEPLGLVIVTFKKDSLEPLIPEDTSVNQMLILNDEAEVVSGNYPAQFQPNELKERLSRHVRENETQAGHFLTTIQQESWMVMYRVSSYNGWLYVSLASMDTLHADSRAIGWFTFVSCIVIFIATSVLAVHGSRRMYRPIRRLHQRSGLHEKRKDEFGSIEERLNTLVRSETRLGNQLREQLGQMREWFMLRLLSGQMTTKEAERKFAYYSLPTSWSTLYVLAIQMDVKPSSPYTLQDQDLFVFGIQNIIQDLQMNQASFPPVMKNAVIYLLVSHDKDEKESIAAFAERIKQAVQEYLHMEISIGMSRSFIELKGIHKACEESREALVSRIQLGHGVVLSIADVKPDSLEKFYPEESIQEVVAAVKSMRREEISEQLHQFVHELKQKNASFYENQLTMVRLFLKAICLAQEQGIGSSTFLRERDVFGELLALPSLDAYEEWLRDTVLYPLAAEFEKQQPSERADITKQMLQMIEEKADTDLTLEYCASTLHFHATYLSRVFKKDMGMSFSEYLMKHRLTLAKAWLRDSNLKVADIAEQLRYSSSASFIRYFRKMEGMTPGKYRQAHQFEQRDMKM
ncbi:helix-turn-helix domain-containing protein [Aureibacillus halotolerans]|uniref:AraC-like DNA-binding protein n=1 Tax=Aureibacillus halotolerans TaxID=1508390 RepID=A0A4R6U8I3_9BACI|nr:helix-turn-helix domain-containing protein [Aureibacillus halotolerans]TDQ42890.1 AraC-like DNA-binding protein [Aureibacillus halotolerans]